MAAVGVRLDVAWAHRGDGPDRDRLLALAEVRSALDLPAHEQLLDLLLEQPDADHRLVPAQAIGGSGGRVSHQCAASGWSTRGRVAGLAIEHSGWRYRFQFRLHRGIRLAAESTVARPDGKRVQERVLPSVEPLLERRAAAPRTVRERL